MSTSTPTQRRAWVPLVVGLVIGAVIVVAVGLALGYSRGGDGTAGPSVGAGDRAVEQFEPVQAGGILFSSIRVSTRADEDQSADGPTRTAFELGENPRIWVAYDAQGSTEDITVSWSMGELSDTVTQAASDEGLFVLTLGERATATPGAGTITVTVGDSVVAEVPFTVQGG